MKLISLIIVIALAAATASSPYAAPLSSTARVARQDHDDDHDTVRLERTVAAQSNVVVTVCIASGDVIVRGWDRGEVRASTTDAEQLELRGGVPGATAPASRVEVLVSNGPDTGHNFESDCNAASDITLDVPRGASVQVKTRDGEIEVADVADARLETLSGYVAMRHIGRRVEASSVSGDVSLDGSGGPVRLRSISGSIEASNARTLDATDDFEANTVSGDVMLSQVAHSRVEARTVSGIVSMKGPLARGGRYDFKTTSGDMMFTLPDDSSFRISARIPQGEIVTDFSLKDANRPNPANPGPQFLTGTHGTGDATLDLYSFSGTVHLRRNSK
ncbi:MAG: DUF4097 family beta strand repeat-containing protein [Pyrinomonadaceae bacterium]